jgi:hypothetical protein
MDNPTPEQIHDRDEVVHQDSEALQSFVISRPVNSSTCQTAITNTVTPQSSTLLEDVRLVDLYATSSLSVAPYLNFLMITVVFVWFGVAATHVDVDHFSLLPTYQRSRL